MLRDCWEGQGWLSMMLQEGILRSGTVCILTGLINLIAWLKDDDRWSGRVIFFIFFGVIFIFRWGHACARIGNTVVIAGGVS